jgi:hypothetical protein
MLIKKISTAEKNIEGCDFNRRFELILMEMNSKMFVHRSWFIKISKYSYAKKIAFPPLKLNF